MRILGLDVSTSCTGFAIVDIDHDSTVNLHKIGHIDTSKKKTLWEKIDHFEQEFKREIDLIGVDAIYIEEALLSFRTGASNANTITKLVMFNALVSNLVRQHFQLTPVHIPSQTARKTCGIKVQSRAKTGVTVKQQTFDQVTQRILPSLKIDMTRTGKPKPYMFDQIDAYVVGHAGALLEQK